MNAKILWCILKIFQLMKQRDSKRFGSGEWGKELEGTRAGELGGTMCGWNWEDDRTTWYFNKIYRNKWMTAEGGGGGQGGRTVCAEMEDFILWKHVWRTLLEAINMSSRRIRKYNYYSFLGKISRVMWMLYRSERQSTRRENKTQKMDGSGDVSSVRQKRRRL